MLRADREHPMTDVQLAPADDGPSVDSAPAETAVEEELLVEEVSIDGMCGVY
jgi:mycofactocin precursor